jgi:hypothetical protein
MARAVGIEIGLDGADLLLKAASKPPAEVLHALARHKAEIVALLRPGRDGWSAEDWQVFFDERAGIAEFDGGLPRIGAEARAFAWCVVEWMNRNPIRSAPDRCCWCGGDEREDNVLLPFGAGHSWLHSACWLPGYKYRQSEAVAFLRELGIAAPPDFPNDFGKKRST